jgi:hypothetical protein
MRRPFLLVITLPLLIACMAIPVERRPDETACVHPEEEDTRVGGGATSPLRDPPPLPEGTRCAALRKHLIVGAFPALYQYVRDDDVGEPADKPRDFYPPKGLNWAARIGLSGVMALGIAGWNTVTLGVPTAFMWLGEPFFPWSSNSTPCYPTAVGFCKVERWTVSAQDVSPSSAD